MAASLLKARAVRQEEMTEPANLLHSRVIIQLGVEQGIDVGLNAMRPKAASGIKTVGRAWLARDVMGAT